MNEPTGETFLVYAYPYWGKGATLAEAKRKFYEEGGRLSRGYTILVFDADTVLEGVDLMGRYYYHKRNSDEAPNPPTETVVKPLGQRAGR